MNFSRRVKRVAIVAWAFYLMVALTAFALHVHSSHEGGDPSCALCIGHNITGAVAGIAPLVLAAPVLLWGLRLWLARARSAFAAPIARALCSRGPPATVFFLNCG